MLKQLLSVKNILCCTSAFLWCTEAVGTNPDSLLNVTIEKATALFTPNPQAALQMLLTAEQSPGFEAAGCAMRSLLYHKTGVCYFRLKSYREALTYFRDRALPLRTNCLGKNHLETANTTYNVAMMFRNLSNREAEADYLRRSIGILEGLPPAAANNMLARNYKEAAELFRSLSDYATAKRYLQGSKTLLEKTGSFEGKEKALWLYRWGTLQADLKSYAEAFNAFEQSLAIYRQLDSLGFKLEIAHCNHELGRILYYEKSFPKAVVFCRKAMQIYAATPGEAFNLSMSHELMGNIQKQRRQYRAALKSFQEALALRKQLGDKTLIANAWENTGDVYIGMGQLAKGLDCYKKGADSPLKTDAIRAGLLRAEALRKSGLEKKDRALLAESLNLYVQIDSILIDLQLFYKDKDSKTALFSESRAFYESAIGAAYWLYQSTADKSYLETAYRFCAGNKAALLLEAIGDLEARSLGLPDSLSAKELALRRRCQQLLSAGAPEFDLERLRYQHFVQGLEQTYPAYYRLKHQLFKKTSSAVDLQRLMADDAAVLEYFKGKNSLYVFLISHKTGLLAFEQPVVPSFEEACRQLRLMAESIDDDNAFAGYSKYANTVFQTLLQPALAAMPTEVGRLCMVTDAGLRDLPFDILPTRPVSAWEGAQTPLLLKRFALSQSFSSRWMLYQAQSSDKRVNSAKLFGGFGLEYDDSTLKALMDSGVTADSTLFKRNVGKLYFSDDEVRESASLLQGDAFLNEAATKRAFLQNLEKYQIIHLAMHGLLNMESPLQSALVFSRSADALDFKLNLAEVFGLHMPAQLAVLSACNTYGGPEVPGEGLNSLALAFAHAGCASIVANQWSASDQSSKDIIVRFYDYLKQGLSKDRALQQAKLSYLNESMPTFSRPSYWANLILIGDATPILMSGDTLADSHIAGPKVPLAVWILGGLFFLPIGFYFYRSFKNKA